MAATNPPPPFFLFPFLFNNHRRRLDEEDFGGEEEEEGDEGADEEEVEGDDDDDSIDSGMGALEDADAELADLGAAEDASDAPVNRAAAEAAAFLSGGLPSQPTDALGAEVAKHDTEGEHEVPSGANDQDGDAADLETVLPAPVVPLDPVLVEEEEDAVAAPDGFEAAASAAADGATGSDGGDGEDAEVAAFAVPEAPVDPVVALTEAVAAGSETETGHNPELNLELSMTQGTFFSFQ